MHLTRYPRVHTSLLHHSLKSDDFIHFGSYTSLLLALGFTRHMSNINYLYATVKKSPVTVALFLNHGMGVIYVYDFLSSVPYSQLRVILKVLTTHRIIEIFDVHIPRYCIDKRGMVYRAKEELEFRGVTWIFT